MKGGGQVAVRQHPSKTTSTVKTSTVKTSTVNESSVAGLGPFEREVLAVLRLQGETHPAALKRRLDDGRARAVSLAQVCICLERLLAKGIVADRVEPGRPVRGGRRRRMFVLAIPGGPPAAPTHHDGTDATSQAG